MTKQGMSRRDFLKASGAGTLAALFSAYGLSPALIAAAQAVDDRADVQELHLIGGVVSANNLISLIESSQERRLMWMPLLTRECGFTPMPALAESWEVSDDQLTWTFTLRQDAKFSDGSPITANEVAWSFGYYAMLAHPDFYGVRQNYSYFRNEFDMIVGADEVIAGNVPANEFDAAPLEGAQALDDYTFQLTLTRPHFYMLESLSNGWFGVVKPESVMAGAGKDYSEDSYWNTEPDAVFSGPFKLESFTSGQGYTMVPNEHFYGGMPILERIRVTFSPDNATAIAAFQNQEANAVVSFLTPDEIRQAQTDDYLNSSLVEINFPAVFQMWMTPYAPMDDVHVRRAVNMAIDKQQLVTILDAGAGLYEVINGHFTMKNPSCMEQRQAVVPVTFDPEAARAELAMSKYGDAVLDMEINIVQWGPDFAVWTQVVQQMLQENLGLRNVKIRTEQIADWNQPPFPTHLWPNGQGDDTADPRFMLNNMISTMATREFEPGENIPVVTTAMVPELRNLIEEVDNAADNDARCEAIGRIYQTWVDNAFSIDVFTRNSAVLVAPIVKNYDFCPDIRLYQWGRLGETYIAKA
jgi:ABC-type transport system substrate-binding protein